jgi:aconitate hydratase 2/2-methylisocitrate dehydratase
MPLDMPESVLVKFTGEMQPGITLRDLVNAIPYAALQRGLLTVEKKGKKNVYNGRILEIQGLPKLTVEQAFELSDASAERSAGGCTIDLSEESVAEYLRSNVVMLRWMIANGYGDVRTLERRAVAMEEWLANPSLLRADENAEYAEVIEINMSEITEPLLACPNDPDDVKPLSEVAGTEIEEVFIGSCMTNIGHFRAAGKLLQASGESIPSRLWIAPPTRMDEQQLMEEGFYNIYAQAGARTEMPGCSLCMGNQARIRAGSTCVSTSTRNFPNRLGQGSNVFLASAELAAVAAILGRLPTNEEYQGYASKINSMAPEIYNYLNFDQVPEFLSAAEEGRSIAREIVVSA